MSTATGTGQNDESAERESLQVGMESTAAEEAPSTTPASTQDEDRGSPGFGRRFPWWVKLGTKLAVGVLPVSYESLRATFTGYRGAMQDPEYADRVFDRHFAQYECHGRDSERAGFFELGPGGGLMNGVVARARGFREATLIDVGSFAIQDVEYYSRCFEKHWPEQLSAFRAAHKETESVLAALGRNEIHYEVDGLAALRRVSSASVSFSFSQAVFEHVRRNEFDATMRELFRIHRPGSVSSHRVDFKDHLGGALNNLRFRERVWESRWFPNDGFYTNRLRYSDVRAACERAGFEVVGEELDTWDKLPLSKRSMAREFADYPDSALLVRGADMVLRRPGP